MTPELSRRIARAFHTGEANVAERDTLISAAQGANSFNDLPATARALVLRLEHRGRTNQAAQVQAQDNDDQGDQDRVNDRTSGNRFTWGPGDIEVVSSPDDDMTQARVDRERVQRELEESGDDEDASRSDDRG